jgi:hypothetical protein
MNVKSKIIEIQESEIQVRMIVLPGWSGLKRSLDSPEFLHGEMSKADERWSESGNHMESTIGVDLEGGISLIPKEGLKNLVQDWHINRKFEFKERGRKMLNILIND